jgi:hypothetical protein
MAFENHRGGEGTSSTLRHCEGRRVTDAAADHDIENSLPAVPRMAEKGVLPDAP